MHPFVAGNDQGEGVELPWSIQALWIAIDVVGHPMVVHQPLGLLPAARQLLWPQGLEGLPALLPMRAEDTHGGEHFVVHARHRSIRLKQVSRRCRSHTRG